MTSMNAKKLATRHVSVQGFQIVFTLIISHRNSSSGLSQATMPRAPRTPRNHDWRQPDSWPVKDGHIKHSLAELTILELKKVLTFAARKFDPVAKSVIVTANKIADKWNAEAAGKATVTSYIDERQYRQYKLKFESYIKEKAIEDAIEDLDFKTAHDSLEAAANKYKTVASAIVDKVVDSLVEDITRKRVDFTPRERNICDQLNLPCRFYPPSLYHVKEHEASLIVDEELKIIRQKCSRSRDQMQRSASADEYHKSVGSERSS